MSINLTLTWAFAISVSLWVVAMALVAKATSMARGLYSGDAFGASAMSAVVLAFGWFNKGSEYHGHTLWAGVALAFLAAWIGWKDVMHLADVNRDIERAKTRSRRQSRLA